MLARAEKKLAKSLVVYIVMMVALVVVER